MGEEALYDLVSIKKGNARFYSKEIDMPEKISGNTMSILLEAARMHDEGTALYGMIDSVDSRLQIKSRRVSPEIINEIGRDWIAKVLIMIDKNKTIKEILNNGMMSRCRTEYTLVELLNAGPGGA